MALDRYPWHHIGAIFRLVLIAFTCGIGWFEAESSLTFTCRHAVQDFALLFFSAVVD